MKKYIKICILSLIILFMDILTKVTIINSIELNNSTSIIGDFFKLTLLNNHGAAWNILNNKIYFLILISVLSLTLLIYMIKKEEKITKLNTVYYGLIIGGIAGNLLNRIFLGYVIDFLDFNIFGYNFPVFNIADVAIVISIFLMILELFRKDK